MDGVGDEGFMGIHVSARDDNTTMIHPEAEEATVHRCSRTHVRQSKSPEGPMAVEEEAQEGYNHDHNHLGAEVPHAFA